MMKRIHLQLLSIILVSSWYLATTAAITGQSWEEERDEGGREVGREGQRGRGREEVRTERGKEGEREGGRETRRKDEE